MNLAQAFVGQIVEIEHVGGERAFRRRLMELGLVPGTRVKLVGVAPLGDPIELLVRGCSLSIRRADASSVAVRACEALASAPANDDAARLGPLAAAPNAGPACRHCAESA